MGSKTRSFLVLLALTTLPAAASQAQSVAPLRNSVLFRPAPVALSDTTATPHDDRVPATIMGALLFGVLSAAFVSDADGGSLSENLPIVIGATATGGLIGYLVGSLLSSD